MSACLNHLLAGGGGMDYIDALCLTGAGGVKKSSNAK